MADTGERTENKGKRKWERRLWWLHSMWALSFGVFVVVYAADSFERARWLMLTLISAWVAFLGFYRVFGEKPSSPDERGLRSKAGYWALTYLLKNLYQTMLFFVLPFYWKSATLGTVNQWFVLGLAVLALIATLDLVVDNVLMPRKWLASTYFVVILFAAANLALPALLPGLGARWSLLSASVLSVILFLTMHPRLASLNWRRPERVVLAVGGALIVGMLITPGIPPVPHYLVRGQVGLERLNNRVGVSIRGIHAGKMDEMYAVTEVLAPGEGEAMLVHVWRRDGAVVWPTEEQEITQQSRDGATVRSWSNLPPRAIPRPAAGRWSVDVETGDGRLVGRLRFRVYGAR
ncbi:MAG: hypothetical protein ACI9WU_004373 [Myxococcota bacterium]|jgi:hypothetical protein